MRSNQQERMKYTPFPSSWTAVSIEQVTVLQQLTRVGQGIAIDTESSVDKGVEPIKKNYGSLGNGGGAYRTRVQLSRDKCVAV